MMTDQLHQVQSMKGSSARKAKPSPISAFENTGKHEAGRVNKHAK